MEIIRGKRTGAKKVVVYGPEGIGKSTFASRFPEPLFIDTEGSTRDMDVARTPSPSSWTMLMEQIEYVRSHPTICKTLVVDTIDWAEGMCISHVCASHQKKGVEDFGYGKGYIYVKEEFGRFLNKLSEVIKAGINVVLTAHTQLRKFEQPDEMGAYDRYELKLGQKTQSQTSPLAKEWADMVLFANYKTYSVAVDDKGKKHKAQGGKRVMYTTHHPCWDAKNRYGLPEEMDFDYAGIAHIMEETQLIQDASRMKTVPKQDEVSCAGTETAATNHAEQQSSAESVPMSSESNVKADGVWESDPGKVPQALKDLMLANQVSEWDIQNVVAARGYYPGDVPIERYDPGFVQGVLVSAWPKVFAMIREMKEKMEIPFN